MSIDYIISEICNSRIREVILIGDNTTLLDYEYQFMGSLHIVNSSHGLEFRLVVIYIEYWSAVNSL